MPPSPQPPAPSSRLTVFYGGTFDPVHDGHLAIARAARDALGTTIRMMPAADPPHRVTPGADAGQRAAMLDLAVHGEAGLRVDRRELRREGRSYSIDTLRELRGEYGPAAPLALLVGADSFVGLPEWREWRSLFAHAHFVVAERPGSPLDGALPASLADEAAGRWCDAPQALLQSPAGRIWRLRQPLRHESASDIRHRIETGRPWRGRVPPAVADYIERGGLYLNRAPHGPLTPSPL